MSYKLQPIPTALRGNGFTHEATISYEDLIGLSAVDDTAGAITLTTAGAGDILEAVSSKVVTEFDNSGSGQGLLVDIGGTDADGAIIDQEVDTNDTPDTYAYNTGAYFVAEAGTTDPANATNGKQFTAAENITLTVTPGGTTAYALSELTAGELKVKVRLISVD